MKAENSKDTKPDFVKVKMAEADSWFGDPWFEIGFKFGCGFILAAAALGLVVGVGLYVWSIAVASGAGNRLF